MIKMKQYSSEKCGTIKTHLFNRIHQMRKTIAVLPKSLSIKKFRTQFAKSKQKMSISFCRTSLISFSSKRNLMIAPALLKVSLKQSLTNPKRLKKSEREAVQGS
jgi:hypothetical protein